MDSTVATAPVLPARQFNHHSQLELARDVHLVCDHGMARLFDLNADRCFALDPVGTTLLRGALSSQSAAALTAVAGKYGVSPEVVAGDWQRLRDELISRRLLCWRKRTSADWRPSPLTVYPLLALAWLSIRVLGFVPSIRLWGWTSNSRRLRSLDGDEDVIETARRVDLRIREIAATHLLCCQCKERSLVAWYVLRHRLRVSPKLVVGAMFYPFQAHAWVECDGLLLTDESHRCGEYLRVVEFA